MPDMKDAEGSGYTGAVERLNLQPFVDELAHQGLTIVPPEVTGVTDDLIDRCVEVLLDQFEQQTGARISLEAGPLDPLEWPVAGGRAQFSEKGAEPSQTLLQQLLKFDRCFRDLAVNPVVDAIVDQMIGAGSRDRKPARRLSSANSFIKWRGDFGYGPGLGLHCDQGANPLPWSETALTANATWALTDYTKEGGALAYVPGSHKFNANPEPGQGTAEAIAAEAPRGSAIIFPGSTWHGAFHKQTDGLRLCAISYYRHASVLPQENMSVSMADQPWDDCDDPELMRELIGFDDGFPYLEQSFALPRRAAS